MSKSKWLACSVNSVGYIVFYNGWYWVTQKRDAMRYADKRTAAKYGTPVKVKA